LHQHGREVLDMQNRNLDSSGFDSSSEVGGSSDMSGATNSGSSRSRPDQVRDSSSSEMSTVDEDLQQQQIEGNLGNERVRSHGRE
jgi:hypothetical protein